LENFYYYDYLKKYSNKEDIEYLDLIKYELDMRIYYYGQHFKTPKEGNSNKRINYYIKNIIKNIFWDIKYYFTKIISENNNNILSNAYFTINSELSSLGYNVISPPWNIRLNNFILPSKFFYNQNKTFLKKINNNSFFDLLNNDFKYELYDFIINSKEIYKKYINALFVPQDMSVMERIIIKVFKEINKPSFIFLHGLPGRYNNFDENRSDYLIVWGEKIKEIYLKQGFSPNKIFVSGHPYYKYLKTKELIFSLENILIITKSVSGAQHSDFCRVQDRGNLITYLFSIQFVLQKFGVKSVRFRPHPSENGDWYLKYIDKNFFHLDNKKLDDSLINSSLIIGPTSTVVLEAIYMGINYIVYEPVINDINLEGLTLVPPFDGSDNRLPVAKDEENLYEIIKNKAKIDISVWHDYIKTPFDISFIKNIL